VAWAATPWEIYQDYAADGDLDGTYSNAELEAYLSSAYVDQYGEVGTITKLDALVRSLISARGRFPFTGMEIALMVVGVLVLAGAGVGLRRVARKKT
jgi:hypothetical protein